MECGAIDGIYEWRYSMRPCCVRSWRYTPAAEKERDYSFYTLLE